MDYPYPDPRDFWSRCKTHLDVCSSGMFMGVLLVLFVFIICYFYMNVRLVRSAEHLAPSPAPMPCTDALYSMDPNSPTPAMQSLIDANIRADPGVSPAPEDAIDPQTGSNKKEFFENKEENPELVKLLWR